MPESLVLSLFILAASVVLNVWLLMRAQADRIRLQGKEHQIEQSRFEQQRFEAIASRVLMATQGNVHERAKEELGQTVEPLKEEVGKLQKRLDEINRSSSLQHGELRGQIEQLGRLNQQLGAEASRLSNALRGDFKKQGQWGEMILERVLELAGLRRDREYVSQKSLEDGSGIPDTIVYLPGSRRVIIDSKASLGDYEGFVNASTEEQRIASINRHVLSIRQHIRRLSSKEYGHDRADVFEAVLLFIPIESAWQSAQNFQPQLLDEALAKKILVVTPSTLFPILRVIAQNWEMEKRNSNAQEIARLGGALVDKLVNFRADLDEVEKHLGRAADSHAAAKNKLESGKGNAISVAKRLQDLGAAGKKKLAPDD